MGTRIRALPAERCLAVLLDGDMVRLFRVGDETVEELPASADDSGRNGKRPAAGTSSLRRRALRRSPAGRRRHRDPDLPVLAGPACDHVHRTADRIAVMVRNEHIDRILAGGAPDCVAELRRILRTRLGGDIETLCLPAGASAAQVREAACSGSRAGPGTHEDEVLGDLIEAVGRGLAALGPVAVAEAVNDHRATALVLGNSAPRLPGAVCPRCGNISVPPVPPACTACGVPLTPVADVLGSVACRICDQGGSVEHVLGPAGDALAPYNGVAALLRYAFPGSGRACPWEEPATV